MATTTKRGLNKPERTSFVDVITAINNNMENIDDAVPDTRKVNGKALSSDVTIDDADLPIIAGKIASTQAMIAPPFVEATPNAAGSYVTNAGALYYLPDGHTANATWANTTKTEVKAGSELTKLKSAFDGTNRLIGNVDFTGTPNEYSTSIASRIKVKQYGNVYLLNNTSPTNETTSTTQRYYRLNDGIEFQTSSDYTSDTLRQKLIGGHRYRFCVKKISGSVTGTSDSATLRAFVKKTGAAICQTELIPLTGMAIKDYIPTSDEYVNIVLRTSNGVICTNLVIGIYLIDITEAITGADYGDDILQEMRNYPRGINKAIGVMPLLYTRGAYPTPAVGNTADLTNPVIDPSDVQFLCAKAPISPGQSISFKNGGASSSYRDIALLDSNFKVLYIGGTSARETTITVNPTSMSDAAWVVINTKATISDYYAFVGASIQTSKQDKLTFDDTPTEDSANPVTSDGVWNDTNEIRSVIGEQQTQIGTTFDLGWYWNSETTTAVKTEYSDYIAYDPVSVTPGAKVRLYCTRTGASSKQWPFLFVNDDYTIISHEGTRDTFKFDTTVIVPDGATKLLMTASKSHRCRVYTIALKPINNIPIYGAFNYKDKNIVIIGDSISTNGDYSATNPLGNVPEIIVMEEDVEAEVSLYAYVTTYDIGTELHGNVTIDGVTTEGHTIESSDVGKEITLVPAAEDVGTIIGKPLSYNAESRVVWWETAAEKLEFNPIPVCWSGSSISSHEGGTAYAWHDSTIRKCGIRTPGTMTRVAPDMIIVARGVNDFSHSPYAKVEEDYLFSTMHGYPTNDTYEEGGTTYYSFPRACVMLVKKLRAAYPGTPIVFCTLNYFQRMVTSYPTRTGNTGSTYPMWNRCIRDVANALGCSLIEFDKDGITYENVAGYTVDSGSNHVHPNNAGHQIMANRAVLDLAEVNGMS